MSTVRKSDPLLTITQLLLRVGMAILVLGIVLAAGAAIAVMIVPDDDFIPKLAERTTQWWVFGAAALCAVMMTLYLFFVRHLSRIVATVGTGDPFQPENADRLERMAWLTLILQGCMIVLAPLATMIADRIGSTGGGLDISFDSLLLALVLFVLARVFRRGTAMRDDLEGTV